MIIRTGPNRFLVLGVYVALVIVALMIVSSRTQHASGSGAGTGTGVQQTQYAGPEGY